VVAQKKSRPVWGGFFYIQQRSQLAAGKRIREIRFIR
jgi:hypothetical protein